VRTRTAPCSRICNAGRVGSSPCAVVVGVAARLEAVGFGHGCCLGDTICKSSQLVGVAAESDGQSAFLVPPASDLGQERPSALNFKRPAAVSKHTQCVTGHFLERAGSNLSASRAQWRSLYTSLRRWGVGQRGSKLVPIDAFASALRAALPQLEQLEPLKVDTTKLPHDLTEQVWQLVSSLGVGEKEEG
jgi:hypothetical protein